MRTKVQGTARALELVAYLAAAELYDPDSQNWSPVRLMHAVRDFRKATLLPNRNVLVKSGYNGGAQSSVEIHGRFAGLRNVARVQLRQSGGGNAVIEMPGVFALCICEAKSSATLMAANFTFPNAIT